MDDGSWLQIIFLVILLLFAFYFAIAETSFASVSRTKIKARQERGEDRAVRVLYVLDNFDKSVTTALIGTNIVHIGMGVISTLLVTRLLGVSYAAAMTVVVTVIVFFLGEMLPKSIAKKYSEGLSLSLSASLCFFMRIFSPFSYLLTALGAAVALHSKSDSNVTVTEDELYDIIEDMTDNGSLDAEQAELVSSALMFDDVTVETVLTARVDMVAVEIEDPCEEILETIKASRHSRLPVYQDSPDNIVGILQIRKYIRTFLAQGASVDIGSLVDKPYFTHGSTKIDELLREMSREKINMAVVSDNYGGTLGIVTVEDILEELVGEIWDEDDVVVSKFEEIENGFEVDASLSCEDTFDLLGFEDYDEEDFLNKLMGEWAYECFDLMPQEGNHYDFKTLSVTVSKMQNQRIMKLTVTWNPEAQGGEDK